MISHPETAPASSACPMPVPPAWDEMLTGYTWRPIAIGQSSARVFCLECPKRPTLFLKAERTGPHSEVPAEADRLRWMHTGGIARPVIWGQATHADRDLLVTHALAGRDLASAPDLPPQTVVGLVAEALRALHRVDIASCPFDARLDHRIALAGARTAAGVIDESDFDDIRLGRTAADLFEELMRRRPEDEDLVVTHGDACLPNLLADKDTFTGFVDCARLGVADRHQDIALAARSIRTNLGGHWESAFLRDYGGPIDPDRLAFYQLLDEFF